MSGTVLSRRGLNRATLERQMLLRRGDLPLLDAVERLAGLQSQTTHTWYQGLWCRLEGFDPRALADLLERREVVRIALMRSTIHLVTARDCLAWRPLVQPVIERSMNGNFGKNLVGLDRKELLDAGRAIVEDEPKTFSELGRMLAERWPDRDPASLAQAIRAWAALIQVPPRGVWGKSGRAAHTTAEAWLGRPLASQPAPADLVRRYLAAFGPATVKDIQTWSGLTRLNEVVEPLRPRLATFQDEQGRELFDLPEAPRPDPDTPAPVRLLYDYDNLLLSHADRSRVVEAEDYSRQNFTFDGAMPAIVLVDGFTKGNWTVARQRAAATLTIQPWETYADEVVAAVTDEGNELLDLLAPKATEREVRILPPS